MEDTLGVHRLSHCARPNRRLNPCSNGRYSRRQRYLRHARYHNVLILVLMENTLGARELDAVVANGGS